MQQTGAMKDDLKEIFKKSLAVLKSEGVVPFLRKGVGYFLYKIKLEKIKMEMANFLLKHFSLKKLKNFSSFEPEEVWNFSYKFCLGAIRPNQIKEEFVELLKLFRDVNPRYILEIGTAQGGSLFCFCKLAREDAVIISIDLPGGKFGGGYPMWRVPIYKAFAKPKQKLILLRADSHKEETLEKARGILGGNLLDFLFIDGDHTYEGVMKDFEMYSGLVKDGGIIVFHDVALHHRFPECHVPDFWAELCKRYPNQCREIIKDRNQGWGGIGIFIYRRRE
jgi:predicted O-methyltransferase YrrM